MSRGNLHFSRRRLDRAIVVALGGNLPGAYGSVQGLLEAAVEAMDAAGLRIWALSQWWRSEAWPDPADPPFLNGVVLVDTRLDPAGVLDALQGLEAAFGRVRDGARNAPRTLDLDLIAFGREVLDTPGLILPHPRAHERAFVMGPLAEIAPDWTHPVLGDTAAALAGRAPVGADARAAMG